MKYGKHRLLCLILASGFLLGSYKGYLALWTEDSPNPRQIYPCPVSALPPADQQALEDGIRIGNQEDLSRLLEDFLS